MLTIASRAPPPPARAACSIDAGLYPWQWLSGVSIRLLFDTVHALKVWSAQQPLTAATTAAAGSKRSSSSRSSSSSRERVV